MRCLCLNIETYYVSCKHVWCEINIMILSKIVEVALSKISSVIMRCLFLNMVSTLWKGFQSLVINVIDVCHY